MWNEILEQIMPTLVSALGIIITAVASWVALKIKNIAVEKANTEMKQTIVTKVVAFVDQKLSDLPNDEKFQVAIDKASEWLLEKKIPVTATELEILVEAAVKGAHQGLNKETPTQPVINESPEVQVLEAESQG